MKYIIFSLLISIVTSAAITIFSSNATEATPPPRLVKTIPWGANDEIQTEGKKVKKPQIHHYLPTIYAIDQTNIDSNEIKWREDIIERIISLIKDNTSINDHLSFQHQTVIVHVFIEENGKMYFRDIYSSNYNPSLSITIGDVFSNFHPFPPPPVKADGNLHLKITLPRKRSYIDTSPHIAPAPQPHEWRPAPTPQPHPDYPPNSQLHTKGPITISIAADLSVFVNEERIARTEINNALNRVTGGDKEMRVFVRADRSVTYNELTSIMALIASSGYTNIGLVAPDTAP